MSALRRMRALAVALAFGLSLSAAAGPAEDARAAYDRGDYATAVRIWTALAEQGDAMAQSNLGFMYQSGRGVTKDETEAVHWFHRAALQGFADAQDNLGSMYANGRGVATDDAAAVEWFRKAAEQGNASAQYNLGVMYARGRGVANDDAAAVLWYRKAADQGLAAAQYNLGAMYAHGRGVANDDAAAVLWYRRAAEQGLAVAQTNLGILYGDGRGVAPDRNVALQWLRKAAEQGDTQAQDILASIERQERDAAAMASTIATLVKKYEAAQPAARAPDPERAALAREIIEISGAREKLPLSSEQLKEALSNQRTSGKVSPQLLAAFHSAAAASFRLDRILASWERELAATLDAATLRAGLEWERSDLGRRIHRLEMEAAKPEQHAAMKEFARQFADRGATSTDARGRACAQKDILDNSAEYLLPVFEAVVAAGVMAESTRKGKAMDMDGIAQAVVSMRPVLRDASRQGVLIACMYSFRDVSDAELEQWLGFLRTDSGGRYARGRNAALRTALLESAEVFTRTLVDVARQLQGRSAS